MPLESGKSSAAFSHNVKAEIAAGKPQKQAVAIAYSKTRGDKALDAEPEKREPISETTTIKREHPSGARAEKTTSRSYEPRASTAKADAMLNRTPEEKSRDVKGDNQSKSANDAWSEEARKAAAEARRTHTGSTSEKDRSGNFNGGVYRHGKRIGSTSEGNRAEHHKGKVYHYSAKDETAHEESAAHKGVDSAVTSANAAFPQVKPAADGSWRASDAWAGRTM